MTKKQQTAGLRRLFFLRYSGRVDLAPNEKSPAIAGLLEKPGFKRRSGCSMLACPWGLA
jgi:hypothetical protein